MKVSILGSAAIASRSIAPLLTLENGFELVAVGYRPTSQEKAEAFAKRFECNAVPVEQVLDGTDAVYIPYPPALHREPVLNAIEQGVHVLCEKPLAVSLADARVMHDAAQKQRVVLLENYMFLHHPQHQVVQELLPKIGELRSIQATFAFPPLSDPNNIRYHRDLGGGALLDAAGYPIQAVMRWLGTNLKVESAHLHMIKAADEGRVDTWGDATLRDVDTGVPAHINFGFDNAYACNYSLHGSKAVLEVPKAYTPKPDQETQVLLHANGETEIHTVAPHDHFLGILHHFRDLITSGLSTPASSRLLSLECTRLQEEIRNHVL